MPEPREEQASITALLKEASDGHQEALDRLLPLVYDELRSIAHRQRQSRDRNATLNTTALVHEAYMKLVSQDRLSWQNRAHFFAIASRFTRRILVDRARERLAHKRGGDRYRVPLDDQAVAADVDGSPLDPLAAPVLGLDLKQAAEFIALDEALDRLAELDERASQVVTYRFFGGLSVEETAEVLKISPATVKRDWSMARAWLHRELTQA